VSLSAASQNFGGPLGIVLPFRTAIAPCLGVIKSSMTRHDKSLRPRPGSICRLDALQRDEKLREPGASRKIVMRSGGRNAPAIRVDGHFHGCRSLALPSPTALESEAGSKAPSSAPNAAPSPPAYQRAILLSIFTAGAYASP